MQDRSRLASLILNSGVERTVLYPILACLIFFLPMESLTLAAQSSSEKNPAKESSIILQFGADVDLAVVSRVKDLMGETGARLSYLDSNAHLPNLEQPEAIVLSFGNTFLSGTLIDQATRTSILPEGFVVRTGRKGSLTVIAGLGKPSPTENLGHGNIGNSYAIYAVLEHLGFAFLRPLAPIIPRPLHLPRTELTLNENPRWRIRGVHIHTQHPIELTDFLQGWGREGPHDEAGWGALLNQWDLYLEWLLANRQNRVEWVLLAAHSWRDFSESTERLERLKKIVDHGHAYGIAIGVDVPLSLRQQHAYRLILHEDQLPYELDQMRSRIDWLMKAEFDFLSTEAGHSEFTHPSADRTLAWMNEFASYTWGSYQKPSYIKVHCSSGQVADGYNDPKSGQPINFNMLPHFANSRLGVLPHTVQHYGLDDPTTTYGQQSFEFIRDFLRHEVGRREVVWYPETAYWVSFDIDVPLFLPIYGERRIHDLRLLGSDENAGKMGDAEHSGKSFDGQIIFSSGWEWGYWLNDVLAARAAWNPQLGAASDHDALAGISEEALQIFGESKAELIKWINAVAAAEHDLLIRGLVNGKPPKAIELRNGQAYLQGFDTWDDISELLGSLRVKAAQMTQPARLGYTALKGHQHIDHAPDPTKELFPLLEAMATKFTQLAAVGEILRAQVRGEARPLIDDLVDAAQMLALRANQQLNLYKYVYLRAEHNEQSGEHLKLAREARERAAEIVTTRESQYAFADHHSIIDWREGPTSYQFGYLWTVHSLYYWWRDESRAIDLVHSPCFMNIINPVDVGFGDGKFLLMESWLANRLSWGNMRGCLDAPAREPLFPSGALELL